jgi:phospholipase C
VAALVLSAGAVTAIGAASRGGAAVAVAGASSPIKHVVVMYQENHSFNDLLGYLCVSEGGRCAGSTSGVISNGRRITLKAEPDVPPAAGHEPSDQIAAINGGKMNGWDHVADCDAVHSYECLTQAHAGRVPTLWKLADTFAMSDRTFETNVSASWGSHLELAAATLDDFTGEQPQRGGGCNVRVDTAWQGPGYPNPIDVPACVPNAEGKGPYRTSPVAYVPTIMDTLDAAGVAWHIYSPGTHGGGGYGWSICPTFYECLGSDQHAKVRQPGDFARDARRGSLPALSIVIPYPDKSQHNGHSLMAGDNWIAKNVDAVMQGPEWNSTAIFLTYDDCGCFYDPLKPPAGEGIRVPMLIISPYAKPRFVDHTPATLSSILAFVERTFGLPPLPGGADERAYDYAAAFDFTQRPVAPIDLPLHRVPASSIAYIAAHPPDPDDPT